MTIIESKINLLNAQIDQLENSGLFSEEETIRLSAPLKGKLQQLAREIEVNE
jgi:hypothetical protein